MAFKEDINIIAKVTTRVNQSLNLEETLKIGLTEVMKVFGTNVGGIYLWDEDLQKLVLKIHKNFTDAFVKKLSIVNPGQGCAGTVKNTGKIVAELEPKEHHYMCADAEKLMGLDCLVAAPINVKGNVAGVLELFAPVYRSLSGKEVKLISILCDILGTAIENSRIHGRLKSFADTLQQAFLPQKPPKLEGGFIQSVYQSATKTPGEIGGDFYDFIKFSDTKVGIMVGDASGKGVEATSLVSLAKGAIGIYAEQNIEPCQVLELANRYITKKTKPSKFVTIFYGVFDFLNKEAIFSSAGHPPPVLLNKDENLEIIKTNSIPLGVELHQHYKDITVKVKDKCSFFIYTDGATDARKNNELFGEKRLLQTIRKNYKKTPRCYVKKVLEDILSYSNNVLNDDIAMVGINFK